MSTNDDFNALFDGADDPRELPADLREQLLHVRADLDIRAAAEAAAEARPLPGDLRDRLVAAGAAPLPDLARRRLLHRLGAPGSSPATTRRWTRATAAAVTVLLVAGGVAVATQTTGAERQPLEVVAPPTTTTTDPAGDTTTTEPAPVVVAAPETTTTTARRPQPAPPAPKERLVAAATCDDLLTNYRTKALELVGPYGLPGGMTVDAVAEASAGPATQSGDDGASQPGHSGTNVQEPGVDEPDMVKTDGRRIFVLDYTDGRRVVRALVTGDGGPSLASTFDVPSGAIDMFLAREHLIVIAHDHQPATDPATRTEATSTSEPRSDTSRPWTSILTFEASDPANVRLVHSRSIEGAYVTSRMSAGIVRVVFGSYAKGPVFDYPRDDSEAEKERALAANRDAVRRSTLDDWAPRMMVDDRRSGESKVTYDRACECDDSMRPNEFSGFGHLTVASIDPFDPGRFDSATVQGGGDIVYASASALYATSNVWQDDRPAGESARTTSIHRFVTEGTAAVRYEASGSVPGYVLNQFSMSEHEGHFRIATTLQDGATSESQLTVLRRDGPALAQVGHVGGLGKGERIYAVRYVGDTGYVVTFRQVDPLYVIDLRDPTAPRVAGELKITGYSAYLHPTDPGRLIGVGQEATEEGQRIGTQVSLFDVSNPNAPGRLDQEALPAGSTSVAEFDHHAFLWWSWTRSMVIPVVTYDRDHTDGDQSSTGAIVFKVSPSALDVQGKVSHDERTSELHRAHIMRSLVIGNAIYTLSDAGLLVSDIETLGDRHWVPLS